MLIHPSMGILPHHQFGGWVTETRRLWTEYLQAGPAEPGYQELVEDFQVAYDDLHKTVGDLPSFDAIVGRLNRAIDRSLVTVMNASQIGGTPNLRWNDRYAHILIGGEVLNRGFTVEGLTVTYMPRSRGVGNVDTVQQRARFFGYKSSYIGYCRVFLERGVAEMFRRYVEHEESLRSELIHHGDAPLKRWKRAFLLDRRYSPTRRNVLGLDIFQMDYAGRWFRPDAPHRNPEAVAENMQLVAAMCGSINDWAPDPGDPNRTREQIHLMARLPAVELLTKLLASLRIVDPPDSVEFTGLLLQLRTFLDEHPGEESVIYRMSGGRERKRSVDPDNDKIEGFFQGRNPLSGQVIYPGDQRIREEDRLSVQIHTLRIANVESPVPAVAVWLPKSMSRGVLIGT